MVKRSKVKVTAWHKCAKIRNIIINSAGVCSISLKFRTDFEHLTPDLSRIFKVNGSKVQVTAWHNVSASKKRYNSGTNKVIKSNVSIAITPPRIARFAFKFGREFQHVTGDTLLMFKIKGQRSRSLGQRSSSQRKVCMYQQQKRYNTAMDSFSDFKFAMAS